MTTLYGYILRELVKTTLLAVAAMTVLFTMGGGLFNVINFEGVSSADILPLIPLILPIAITISLPVAAVFAATMTYGRLAADNELTACRAAGINVHWLFLPAIALALLVSLVVLAAGNILIPPFASRMTAAVQSNLRDLVAQRLEKQGFAYVREDPREGRRTGRADTRGAAHTLTAERVQDVGDADLEGTGFPRGPGLKYLHVNNATYLHVDQSGRLVRFTVAEHGLCMFDARTDPMQITVFAHNARDFEIGRAATSIEYQQVGPLAVPLPTPFRLSFASLRDLMRWRGAPWEIPRLEKDLTAFKRNLTRAWMIEAAVERIAAGQTLDLVDQDGISYRLAGRSTVLEDKALRIVDPNLAVAAADATLPTWYQAGEALLRVETTPTGESELTLVLSRAGDKDALVFEPRGRRYAEPKARPSFRFGPLRIPDAVTERVAAVLPGQIIDPDFAMALDPALTQGRDKLQSDARKWVRKVAATLHFRFGLSSCGIVVIVMGAALGLCFRGSRALSAFAVALIPLFAMLALMLTGRALTEGEATAAAGPLVTWGGLLGTAVIDLLIIRLGVRT